jgi:hypothetical protein
MNSHLAAAHANYPPIGGVVMTRQPGATNPQVWRRGG